MRAPRLPLLPRLANRADEVLGTLGIRPVAIDADTVIARARKETGLEDIGDEAGIDALRRLTRSLEKEARLSLIGRLMVQQDLTRCLGNRMRMLDWRARHPEIDDEQVRRPIFIAGQARTGTTILHELLAQDPANRIPQTWEVDHPIPPPTREHYHDDPRIAQSQGELDQSERLIPDFKRMHRMGGDLPQECVRMTATEFSSLIFAATWRVPGYTRWLIEEADMQRVYSAHRRMLQLLQWRCPGERWVLKSPGHLWAMEAMIGEYPDALVVQTHRDPLEVLSSLSSLELVLRTMASEHAVHEEIAAEWSEWNAIGFERSVAFRESGALPPERVIDVHFRAFMNDPVESIRGIYDHFGLPFTDSLGQSMRRYLDENPSDRDGKHEHGFAETGLDVAEERAKVQRYQDYFGVESEVQL